MFVTHSGLSINSSGWLFQCRWGLSVIYFYVLFFCYVRTGRANGKRKPISTALICSKFEGKWFLHTNLRMIMYTHAGEPYKSCVNASSGEAGRCMFALVKWMFLQQHEVDLDIRSLAKYSDKIQAGLASFLSVIAGLFPIQRKTHRRLHSRLLRRIMLLASAGRVGARAHCYLRE